MLQSLKEVVDGWRQARRFRTLVEVMADVLPLDCDGEPLTNEERITALAIADTFAKSYLAKLDASRAFLAGTLLYNQLSLQWLRKRGSYLEIMRQKTAQLEKYLQAQAS